MLPESASSRDLRVDASGIATEPDPQDDLHLKLNEMVAAVLDIEEVVFSEPEEKHEVKGIADILGAASGTPIAARFVGRLRLNSEAAYDQLDADFKTIQHTPLFRLEEGKHVVLALRGRIDPKPRPWWPNLALFVATLFSVLLVGLNLAVGEIANENIFRASRIMNDFPANLVYGLPFALSILLILGSHELGHYFAARRHGIAVTLPYFIPLPFVSLLGTLGAFIQLQQPLRNRKVLLDVGAAGPLTGLIFAVPILLIGLAGARVDLALPGGIYEGDSIFYALAKILTFGHFLPNGGLDVVITSNQLAWAGWTGLLVSALNLIPIGQLDGGHILYALVGERARRLYFPLMIVLVGLTFIAQVWLLWVVLLLLFGRIYATPLDMITPLDKPRRLIGILAMVVFLLIIVPAPLTATSYASTPQPPVSTGPRAAVIQSLPLDFSTLLSSTFNGQ